MASDLLRIVKNFFKYSEEELPGWDILCEQHHTTLIEKWKKYGDCSKMVKYYINRLETIQDNEQLLKILDRLLCVCDNIRYNDDVKRLSKLYVSILERTKCERPFEETVTILHRIGHNYYIRGKLIKAIMYLDKVIACVQNKCPSQYFGTDISYITPHKCVYVDDRIMYILAKTLILKSMLYLVIYPNNIKQVRHTLDLVKELYSSSYTYLIST